jgi:hypothetical protein
MVTGSLRDSLSQRCAMSRVGLTTAADNRRTRPTTIETAAAARPGSRAASASAPKPITASGHACCPMFDLNDGRLATGTPYVAAISARCCRKNRRYQGRVTQKEAMRITAVTLRTSKARPSRPSGRTAACRREAISPRTRRSPPSHAIWPRTVTASSPLLFTDSSSRSLSVGECHPFEATRNQTSPSTSSGGPPFGMDLRTSIPAAPTLNP